MKYKLIKFSAELFLPHYIANVIATNDPILCSAQLRDNL